MMTNGHPEGQIFLLHPTQTIEKPGGSVAECLTRDREVVGLSLMGGTALCR